MSASLAWIAWNFEIGLPNALRCLGVVERLVERPLGEPDAHRRDADAADVEDVQELLEAGAARAEQVLLGHAAVAEAQRARVGGVPAHLPVRLALLVAGGAVGDDDVGDLLAGGVVLARDRGDADHARDVGAGVRDELLGAVDHPFAVLQPRARARVAGVRAGLGLGQPERAQPFARAQLRQPLALLLLVPNR